MLVFAQSDTCVDEPQRIGDDGREDTCQAGDQEHGRQVVSWRVEEIGQETMEPEVKEEGKHLTDDVRGQTFVEIGQALVRLVLNLFLLLIR